KVRAAITSFRVPMALVVGIFNSASMKRVMRLPPLIKDPMNPPTRARGIMRTYVRLIITLWPVYLGLHLILYALIYFPIALFKAPDDPLSKSVAKTS
ncbi:MAG: hypothetical protein DRN26_05995, partial [Thermoplasmata archaeon]